MSLNVQKVLLKCSAEMGPSDSCFRELINSLEFFIFRMNQMNLRTYYLLGTFKRLTYDDQQHSGTWNHLFVDLPVGWYEIIFEVSYVGLEQGLKAALDNIIYQPIPCIHSGEMCSMFTENPITLKIREGEATHEWEHFNIICSCVRILQLVLVIGGRSQWDVSKSYLIP